MHVPPPIQSAIDSNFVPPQQGTSAPVGAMNRRDFLGAATAGAAGLLASAVTASAAAPGGSTTSAMETPSAKRPKMLFFDVNETLLDLTAMKTSVATALGGRADLLPLWFTTMLHYSLVATVGDNYRDFGEITALPA